MKCLLEAAPTERADGLQLTGIRWNWPTLFEKKRLWRHGPTKRLPEWVFSLPEAQRLALAGGLPGCGRVAWWSKNAVSSLRSVNGFAYATWPGWRLRSVS